MSGLSLREIQSLLPHRPPILLVDAVTEYRPGQMLIATKTIRAGEPCYQHLPAAEDPRGYPYPVSLICESFGQAACLLAALTAGEAVRNTHLLLAGGMAGCTIAGRAYAGEQLEHRVYLLGWKDKTFFLSGELRAGGRPIGQVAKVVLTYIPHRGGNAHAALP